MSQVELIEPTGLHRHPENINSFIHRNPVIRVSVKGNVARKYGNIENERVDDNVPRIFILGR